MTTPGGNTANVAGSGSNVGVQGQIINIGGDVQLTVGPEVLPEAKYKVGVENLKSGKPEPARKLIWEAMMGGHRSEEVRFHWLIAMLSGRTHRDFSKDEINQLREVRRRATGADEWAEGIRLIYQALDPVLSSPRGRTGPKPDMSLLIRQFNNLGKEQQDMVRPHLGTFLTGPLKDEMWQKELELAKAGQLSGNRRDRAWMFFHPDPAKVVIPPPLPERVSDTVRLRIRISALFFAVAAGYIGWGLLWHGAALGLLGYVAGLTGGIVAAQADLDLRHRAERLRRKDEEFRISIQAAERDRLSDRIDTLFKRYFVKYEPDKTVRERWKKATAGIHQIRRNEIIKICRNSNEISLADQVAWLIRYEVRELHRRWEDGTLQNYRLLLLPRPGTATARAAGLAVLLFGCGFAVFASRANVIGIAVALLSASYMWRLWRNTGLEHRRYTADRQEHTQRQADIDMEYQRWSERLKARPKDAEMATWLQCDRTVLLGRALDHFRLPRSRLKTHAFLEEPHVATRRAQIEGGLLRYQKYRLVMFLLSEDGIRQMRADLDFLEGTLKERERTSYRYDAIAAVHVVQEPRRGQMFELRLTGGDPIMVRVREADQAQAPQAGEGTNAEPADETGDLAEDTGLDVASVTNTLHIMEGVAAEGREWVRKRLDQNLAV